jgi:anti-sigma factor RsiW
MNECEQAYRLGAYHDGALSPADRAAVERHLKDCPACTAEWARMQRLSGLARDLATPAMPPGAIARLHERANSLYSRPIIRLAEAMSAVAAAILIACVVGLFMQRDLPAASSPTWDETQAITPPGGDLSAGGSEDRLTMEMVQGLTPEDRP